MRRYILLSYEGGSITAGTVIELGKTIRECGATVGEVHGICMDESEVCSILAKNVTDTKTPVELSIVESSCIYVQRRFGKYFGQNLKLVLAVTEEVLNHPQDKALIQAIKTLAKGISTKMRTQYGLSNDDISVFKQICKNLGDVQNNTNKKGVSSASRRT